jgi:hypothetical protein
MFKTKMALVGANLLKIRLQAEGYIAENQRWIQTGGTPAYEEVWFQHLADEVQAQIVQLEKLQADQDAFRALIDELADCCGTTMDRTCVKRKLEAILSGV